MTHQEARWWQPTEGGKVLCQNWRISQPQDQTPLTDQTAPGEIVQTAGYFQPEAPTDFFKKMDAANVDLKGFTETFYKTYCGAALGPVLETLRLIRRKTDCWLEITNLLIPGANDSEEETTALSRWVFQKLGPEVPVHFSAFHPDHKLRDRGPTPAPTVVRARELALAEGLEFVYTGNIHDPEGSTTACSRCRTALVLREGFQIQKDRMANRRGCPGCGATIPGVWC